MEAMGLIEKILTSTAGSLGFVLGLMFLAGWAIKKVTEIITEHKHLKEENQKTGDKVEKLCEKMDSNMDEIRKDIVYLRGMLELNSDLAKSRSPISLTPKGEELSKEMNAEMIVAENWDKIYNVLENEVKDKNAYDIQQYCMETASVDAEKFFKPSDYDKLKLFAFHKGQSYQYFSIIFAILIRDRYFKEKNIDINEIDKSNLSK